MPDIRGLISAARKAAPGVLQDVGQRALTAGGAASLGAVGGAGVGAMHGFLHNDEEGHGVLQDALSGARTGFLGGAAIGALGGKGVSDAVRNIAAGEGRLGSIARFGKRQVHGFTGLLPAGMSREEGLRAIGASPVVTAERALEHLLKKPNTSEKVIERARKGVEAARELEGLGITNMPGMFKALATSPVKSLKALGKHEWYSSPTWKGRAFSIGLPAVYAYQDYKMNRQDPNVTATGAALGAAGNVLGNMLPGSVAGGMVAGGLLSAGGRAVGNLIGRKGPAPPNPEDGEGQLSAPHVYSPRAGGGFE